jgi:nucleoid DNA-binding protein
MTTNDLYHDYPYRKNGDVIQSYTYVPKDEVSKNRFSLTFTEWKEIVEVFFIYLILFLLRGETVRLPGNFGHIQMKKRKVRQPRRSHYTRCIHVAQQKYGAKTAKEIKEAISENKLYIKWFGKKTNNHQIALTWTPFPNTKCAKCWELWMPHGMHRMVFNYYAKNPVALDNLLEM